VFVRRRSRKLLVFPTGLCCRITESPSLDESSSHRIFIGLFLHEISWVFVRRSQEGKKKIGENTKRDSREVH